MRADILSLRALNRATLARQLLLERAGMAPLDAVEHLVGMQAQIPHDPYLGLWSRLAGFEPDELGRLLVERELVRIVVMRGTIHLVSADDCLTLRPLMQSVLDAELRRHDATALAYACRNLLAFRAGPAARRLGANDAGQLDDGGALARAPAGRRALDRGRRAAPPRGVRARDGRRHRELVTLTGMRAVVERIAPRLRVFRDARGRALYDLPDAPRPHADTPALVRFLPEYDNVLLSHADRARFHRADQPGRRAATPRQIKGTVLVDGVVRATWRIDRSGAGVTLLVDHAGAFTRRDARAVEAEGRRMLRFLEPERAAAAEARLVPARHVSGSPRARPRRSAPGARRHP